MYSLREPSVAVTGKVPLTTMRILLIAVFTVVLLSALACSAQQPAVTPAGGQPSGQEQPQYGGTLIYGVQSASRCLDPFDDACSASRTAEWIYENLVGDDLFDRNWKEGSPEFKQIPALAER